MSRPFSRGFAPISSGASTRLAFVGFCFLATAWIAALGIVIMVANLIFRFAPGPSVLRWILSVVLLGAWGGINWWTSRQLREGRRRALLAGIPIFAIGVYQALASPRGDAIVIGLQVFCLLALLSVWNELDTW